MTPDEKQFFNMDVIEDYLEGRLHVDGQRFCRYCLKPYVADGVALYCGPECEAEDTTRHQRALLRTSDSRIRGGQQFTRLEIFERDGWICGICGKPVDKTLRHPHPMSVALDHLQPVTLGGHHTRSNVRCSHLLCNTKRQVKRKRRRRWGKN